MMKRILIFLATAMFLVVLIAGCTPGSGDTGRDDPDDGRLRVVTTIFPQYDFIRQIAGDRVALSMLISPGAEAHSFDPTPRDIISLGNADLFVYVGGHADEWVHDILASVENETLRTASMMDMVFGHHDHDHSHNDHHDDDHDHDHSHNDDHSHDHNDHDHSHNDNHSHDHNHDHDHGHNDNHSHDHDHDSHVWTSINNAMMITFALRDILSELDPENAEYFHDNAAAYAEELVGLLEAFSEVVNESVRNTVVFGDRFPFYHLMQDFGLVAHAAFEGCGTETQASPGRVAQLIEIVESQHIPVVFYIEFSSQTIANTIAEATDATLLLLHSAHNVSAEDYAAGITFVEIMTRNAQHLRQALS